MAQKFERGGKHHTAPSRAMSRLLLAAILPILVCAAAGELHSKVGRNTVTSGGSVTVTEPIPCYRSREGLFSLCLASGNQRRSCYRSRFQFGNEPLLPFPKTNYAHPCDPEALSQSVSTGICAHICLRWATMRPCRSLTLVGI